MFKRLPRALNSVSNFRKMSTVEPPIIVSQSNNLVDLVLNRPKALNSLSLEMVDIMTDVLLKNINEPSSTVSAFIMKGSGGKAFCAGGDVKSIWTELAEGKVERGTGKPGLLHTDFFRREYIMNYLLGTSKAPQVSIWDGIVMGGGVGISVLGKFRVATEKSLFAMPETAIGLFPDVGSSAWLPHLPEGCGVAIGMTGCRLGAADLLHTGIATHYIHSDMIPELESILAADVANLVKDPVQAGADIRDVLDGLQKSCEKPDESKSVIIKNEEVIRRCFGPERATVEDIVAALAAESEAGSEWAKKTLESMLKMSPTSLKLTLAQLQRGKALDLGQCLQMEYRMIMRCMEHGDFQEGIRALLVDKDNKPVWRPSTLAEVSHADIDRYFEPLQHDYELQLPAAVTAAPAAVSEGAVTREGYPSGTAPV